LSSNFVSCLPKNDIEPKKGNHSNTAASSYCGERPPMRASNPFEDTGHVQEAAGPYPYSQEYRGYQQQQYGPQKYSQYQKGYQG